MGIKGDVGKDVSAMFEELSEGAPIQDQGFYLQGSGPAPARPIHDEALYYEHPAHLKGAPLISEPSANPEGKHTGRIGRVNGMVRTHNKAKGTEEVNGTNLKADAVHAAVRKADRVALDVRFNDKPGRRL